MKGPREDLGDTIPGGLGPALPPRERPWGPLDEKRKRREIEEAQRGGPHGIIVVDGKMQTTRNPPPDERLK